MVARSILKKCAKFHEDSPSGKKVKFNLARVIEVSETADFCVQLCIETLYKRATSVAHLTNFSFEFFYAIFTQDAPLLFYTMMQNSQKMTKNSKDHALLKFRRLHCFFFCRHEKQHQNMANIRRAAGQN